MQAAASLTLALTLILNLNPNPNPNSNANPRSINFCARANTNFIRRRLDGVNPRSEGAISRSINFLIVNHRH